MAHGALQPTGVVRRLDVVGALLHFLKIIPDVAVLNFGGRGRGVVAVAVGVTVEKRDANGEMVLKRRKVLLETQQVQRSHLGAASSVLAVRPQDGKTQSAR